MILHDNFSHCMLSLLANKSQFIFAQVSAFHNLNRLYITNADINVIIQKHLQHKMVYGFIRESHETLITDPTLCSAMKIAEVVGAFQYPYCNR